MAIVSLTVISVMDVFGRHYNRNLGVCNNPMVEKELVRTVLFKIAKNLKGLGINLTRDLEDLYD